MRGLTSSGLARHGAEEDTRWLRLSLFALGIASASLLVLPFVRDGETADAAAVISVVISWSFIAGGFIAWDRRPENRLGALLMVLGFGWTIGRLMGPPTTESSLVYTIGVIWRLAWIAGFVYVLLAFPKGRLVTVAEKLLAGVVLFAAVPMQVLWLLFLEDQDPPNAFLVWPSKSTADAIDTSQRVVWSAAALGLVVLLGKRWIRASRALRRTLVPILAGLVTVIAFTAFVIVDKVSPGSPVLRWGAIATFVAVPAAFLVSVLRSRLARSSVGDLFIELRANPAPEHLRDALARALRDPSLILGYWLPEYETYADLDGLPIELPEDSGRATTFVERDGGRLAALVHDASLREEPALLDAVCAAAGIALENAQLQADLRARLEELKGSRARIVEAAQAERQRLERNLHDGAQQRLVSLSLELGMLGARLDGDAEAKRALDQARRELAESLQELRELARGIHPAVVTGHGLRVALESLVTRAPVQVALNVDLDGRLPEPVEVAAYYLVSESLTNVARYAHASGVTVDVARANGELVVEVVDDGVGGASTEGGSGLRGLADRIEALDGRLRVWSPTGGGTRVRAEIPCA